jgi:hypothetical protein
MGVFDVARQAALDSVADKVRVGVVADVTAELTAQDLEWGVQDHPSFDPTVVVSDGARLAQAHGVISEEAARASVEQAAEQGRLSWAAILVEEVAELFGAAEDDEALRGELIQVAAVAAAWAEALARKSE